MYAAKSMNKTSQFRSIYKGCHRSGKSLGILSLVREIRSSCLKTRKPSGNFIIKLTQAFNLIYVFKTLRHIFTPKKIICYFVVQITTDKVRKIELLVREKSRNFKIRLAKAFILIYFLNMTSHPLPPPKKIIIC